MLIRQKASLIDDVKIDRVGSFLTQTTSIRKMVFREGRQIVGNK